MIDNEFNSFNMESSFENVYSTNETIINDIVVKHEMSIGDIVISTLLIAILIFMILSRVIGGHNNV